MTKELQKKAADKLLSLGVISDKEIDLVVRSDSGEEQVIVVLLCFSLFLAATYPDFLLFQFLSWLSYYRYSFQQMKFVSYHNALKELTKEHSDDEEVCLTFVESRESTHNPRSPIPPVFLIPYR